MIFFATKEKPASPPGGPGRRVLGPTEGAYDVVSSVSAGDRYSATITQHLAGAAGLAVPEHLIDDGAALYFQSAVALRLAYDGKVPAGLAGHWVRFPSWPAPSHHAYETVYSKLSQYPGPGGAALTQLMLDSVTVPYQGGSCGLLLAQLRAQVGPGGHGTAGKNGRATGAQLHLGARSHRVVSSAVPGHRQPRGTGPGAARDQRPRRAVPGLLATIALISTPPAAEVIPAPQIPGLSPGHH